MGLILNWNTNYPSSVDDTTTNFPTLTDGVHDVMASHVNELSKAVIALEQVQQTKGGKITVYDEGVPITTSLSSMDFVGPGVIVSNAGGNITVDISTASDTLQSAYNNGNTIATTAGRTVSFSNSVDATDLLTLSKTNTGGGRLIHGTMGGNTDGDIIYIDNGTVAKWKVDGGGNIQGSAGLALQTTYGFLADSGTSGMYRSAADTLGFSTASTLRLSLNSTALTSTVPVVAPVGSLAAPGLSLATTTGFYLSGNLRFVVAGTERWRMGTAFTPSDDTANGEIGASNLGIGQVWFRDRSAKPTGVASHGSVYTRDSSGTTQLFYTDSADVEHQITTGGGGVGTLQTAYSGGNTIATTAAKAIAFSNGVDTTDLLTLSRTFAGVGDGLKVTMGASTLGRAMVINDGTSDVSLWRARVDDSTRNTFLQVGGTASFGAQTNYAGIRVDVTEGANIGGACALISLAVGGATKFYVHNSGQLRANIGSETVPAYSFSTISGTGMWESGTFPLTSLNFSTNQQTTLSMRRVNSASSGIETGAVFVSDCDSQTGTAAFTSLQVSTVSAGRTASGTFKLFDLKLDSASVYEIRSTGQVLGAAGSSAAPTYSFLSSTGTGMYYVAPDQIGWAAGGNLKLLLNTSNAQFYVAPRPSTTNTFDLGESTLTWRRIYLGTGSVSGPAVAIGASNTGIWAAGSIRMGISGTERWNFTTSSILPAGDGGYSLGASTVGYDTVWFKETTAPTGAADHGVIYTKDVSTVAHLFYKDSADTEYQLTSTGGGVGTLQSAYIGGNTISASTSEGSPTISATDGTNLLTLTTTLSQSSGTPTPILYSPTISQTGTAGYDLIRIAMTETSTGSGQGNFLRFLKAGVLQFRVDSTGRTTVADGTVADPGLRFVNSETSGLYWSAGVNAVNIGITGVRAMSLQGLMNQSPAGTYPFATFQGEITQSGSAGYSGMRIQLTETSTGSGTKYLVDGYVGGSQRFAISSEGAFVARGGVGSATTPTYTWAGQETTGMFTSGTNIIAWSTVGTNRMILGTALQMLGATQIQAGSGSQGAPGIAFTASNTTGIYLAGGIRFSIGGTGYWQFSTGAMSPLDDTGSRDIGASVFGIGKVWFKETTAPTGVADHGALYTKDVSTVTHLFYRDSADVEYQLTGVAAATSLQGAYDGGNTIAVTTAKGSPTISNSADATNTLSISRTFAGAGTGIAVSMGATTTGVGILATMASGATGSALAVNDGTSNTFTVSRTGVASALRFLAADGVVTAPSFALNSNYGFYYEVGRVATSIAGSQVCFTDASGMAVISGKSIRQASNNTSLTLSSGTMQNVDQGGVSLTSTLASTTANRNTGVAANITVNQTASALGYTAFKVDVTPTAVIGTDDRLLDLQVSASSKLYVTSGGLVRGPDGAQNAPTYSFTGATTTGFYRGAASTNINVSCNNTGVFQFATTGVTCFAASMKPGFATVDLGTSASPWRYLFLGAGAVGTPSINFGTTDTGFYAPAGGQVGLTTGGTFRVLWGTGAQQMQSGYQFQADPGSGTTPGIAFRGATDTGLIYSTGVVAMLVGATTTSVWTSAHQYMLAAGSEAAPVLRVGGSAGPGWYKTSAGHLGTVTTSDGWVEFAKRATTTASTQTTISSFTTTTGNTYLVEAKVQGSWRDSGANTYRHGVYCMMLGQFTNEGGTLNEDVPETNIDFQEWVESPGTIVGVEINLACNGADLELQVTPGTTDSINWHVKWEITEVVMHTN